MEQIRTWTKKNCTYCAFRGKNYNCTRLNDTCNSVAKKHLKNKKDSCKYAEYEEI